MEEVWKDIPGYEGIYSISNMGKVRNDKTNRILKQGQSGKGYLMVQLCKDGKAKSIRIHKLVMNAFQGESKGLQINHIDGNKKNNQLSNLEYCSAKENTQHAWNIGLAKHQRSVISLDEEGNEINYYESLKAAAKDVGITGGIHTAIKRNNRLGGFYWKYGEEITA